TRPILLLLLTPLRPPPRSTLFPYTTLFRSVREAVRNAVPPPRKKTVRPHSKLKAAIPFIESILEEDRKSPRKQRHTAHRIWARRSEEHTSELQSRSDLVSRLLLEKKKMKTH